MSDGQVNGFDITEGELLKTFEGAWIGDFTIDADMPITGAVRVELLGDTYSGTVVTDPDSQRVTGGSYGGQIHLRIVGGSGTLSRTVEPNQNGYDHGATVRQVLLDLFSAAAPPPLGAEQLAADILPDLLERFLPQWSWTRGPADGALGALTDYLGVVWTIRADGKVWLGTYDNAAATTFDYDIAEPGIDLKNSCITIAADTCIVRPGQSFDGLRVREVHHQVSGKTRTTLTFDPAEGRPMLRLLQRWGRRALLDYARPQLGKVATQHADGSCEVQLDSSDYPILRNAAIDNGTPDTKVTIRPGARVLVEWPGGVPTAPTITAWGGSAAVKVKIGGSAPAGTQPTIMGTDYRTAQATLDSSLRVSFIAAAVALAGAGNEPTFATAFPAAAAALVAAGQALGAAAGAAKAISDFETTASTKNNFLTQIVEVA